MITDELMPSPLKRTLVALPSGYKSAPRSVGAMRRPYAITSHGTSWTENIKPVERTIAVTATATAAFETAFFDIAEKAAAIAAAAEMPIRICCEARVPIVGMRARLKTSAPAIEPAVFAA